MKFVRSEHIYRFITAGDPCNLQGIIHWWLYRYPVDYSDGDFNH